MKNTTKQVVILDNFSSPYIHQAILILKNYNPALEDKVIEEAERVVGEYLNKDVQEKSNKKGKALWAIIGGSIILGAAILSYIIH